MPNYKVISAVIPLIVIPKYGQWNLSLLGAILVSSIPSVTWGLQCHICLKKGVEGGIGKMAPC